MDDEQKIKELSSQGDEFLNKMEVAAEELILELEDYSLARKNTVKDLDGKFKEIKEYAKEINKISKQYRKLLVKTGKEE